MKEIMLLSADTINQIAAGEVIDRPSSVVKELVENSIDAGALAITVEIKDGGTSLIRITDNGSGIASSQVEKAFLKHTTSKITNAEDLLTVSSLGFRGEALSSIAAVSQVELITKTADAITGTRYRIEGGVPKGLEEVGAPEGTTFISRNLFFNTPARKKFLKTPATEGAYINSLMEHLALSRPDISFRFIQNNQSKLHTSGNYNLKDVIYTIYGRDIAANIIPVEFKGDWFSIKGFIGLPVIARGNRTYENYYINGRYIKSNLINKAIEDGYKSYMMQHKYPFTVLHFDIEPEYIDVNVHPSKMEIRFRNKEEIYDIIVNTIKNALSSKELIRDAALNADISKPEIKAKAPEPFEKNRMKDMIREKSNYSMESNNAQKQVQSLIGKAPVSGGKPFDSLLNVKTKEAVAVNTENDVNNLDNKGVINDSKKIDIPSEKELTSDKLDLKNFIQTSSREPVKQPDLSAPSFKLFDDKKYDTVTDAVQMDFFEEKILTRKASDEYTYIGQLFDTYWLIQYKDTFMMIDQHAAHEKILYEKLLKSLNERKINSQMINPPIVLSLNSNEELLLNEHMEQFKKLGFEIEHFGGKEYAVYSVPDNLVPIAEQELLMELIDTLEENSDKLTDELILEKAASMSCKSAVKGNTRLSLPEAKALINELLNLENPYACPHGRPTIISMTKRDIEKKFKRIV